MNKKIIIIGTLIAVGFGLVRFSNNFRVQNNSTRIVPITKNNTVQLVSPRKFAELGKEKNAFVLDVHTPEQTHIPGTNAFIPYDQIKQNLDKLPIDKSTPVLVYCRSGSMSAEASKEIAALGYVNVYDLDGGTDAYKKVMLVCL